MTTQLTTQQFIERSKQVHGDRYDYSQTVYIGTHSKVKIICSIHGVFEQKPSDHLKGHGCAKCGNESIGWTRTKFKR